MEMTERIRSDRFVTMMTDTPQRELPEAGKAPGQARVSVGSSLRPLDAKSSSVRRQHAREQVAIDVATAEDHRDFVGQRFALAERGSQRGGTGAFGGVVRV